MRDPLLELTTNPRVPLHDSVPAARVTIRRAVDDVLAIGDAALEQPWRWRPDDPHDEDVRYGIYRIHELLAEAATAIERGRAAGSRAAEAAGPAAPPLAACGTARWELHGALVGLPVDAWDAEPGGGEWTIRRTVAHVIASQRGYGWTNAWFLSRADQPDAGRYAPDGVLPVEPDEESEADGPVPDVIARFDGLVDQAIECLASLPAPAMSVPGRWSDLPVTFDFRLGRLGSHIREHTVQVDKTVAMIGLPIREVDRLARLVLATYGRLEGLVVGRSREAIDARLDGGRSAATILVDAVDEAARTAAEVGAASV
jgi:hypothetical protein